MRDKTLRRRMLDANLREITNLFSDLFAPQREPANGSPSVPSLSNRIRRMRPLIGTPEWERRTAEANLPQSVIYPFSGVVFLPEHDVTDWVRIAALERWDGVLPKVGGTQVSDVAALLMRRELADEFISWFQKNEARENPQPPLPKGIDAEHFFEQVILPSRRRAHEHASFA